jgi:hypothetical protein
MAASQSAKRWRWAEGSRKPVKLAAALGATLDALRSKRGTFGARDVVKAARSKSSPIHSLFEWSDARAAEMFREEQARDYVRSLVVVIEHNGEELAMPVAVSFGPGEGYTSTEVAMSSTQLRARLIQQALDEAESWRDRYRHLKELATIFEAIERAMVRRKKRGGPG